NGEGYKGINRDFCPGTLLLRKDEPEEDAVGDTFCLHFFEVQLKAAPATVLAVMPLGTDWVKEVLFCDESSMNGVASR
ncbi:Hypothetical predicted protein, partial [Olea europaea subsp. europaea]